MLAAMAAFPSWPAWSTHLRDARSASTPPGSEKMNIGIAFASDITPSAANEPVSWNTR